MDLFFLPLALLHSPSALALATYTAVQARRWTRSLFGFDGCVERGKKPATGTSSAAFILLAGRSVAARLLGCVRRLRPTLAAAPELACQLPAALSPYRLG